MVGNRAIVAQLGPLNAQFLGLAVDSLRGGALVEKVLELSAVAVELVANGATLATLADKHAETPMAGRTHLQHALPISFGYKCATWLSAIDRHRARLQQLKPRLLVVQFSGAAGRLASLGKDGLAGPAITWRAVRDGFAQTTGLLALIAGTIGKIGYDIMLLMQTEIAMPAAARRSTGNTPSPMRCWPSRTWLRSFSAPSSRR